MVMTIRYVIGSIVPTHSMYGLFTYRFTINNQTNVDISIDHTSSVWGSDYKLNSLLRRRENDW